eukprot:2626723-Ditylum_brightwellii.AAC.1
MDKIQSHLKEEEIMPFDKWISKLSKEHLQHHQDHDAATRTQSIARRFIHQKQMFTDHTAAEELTLMLDTLQFNMKKCLQEMKEEETMPFEEWISMISEPNTTVASNKEHQQQHQDHNDATRIQSISRRFIH